MAISDKIYIKVNENNVYNSNGSFKSLKQIHTVNSNLTPQENLDRYLHPVLNSFGSGCNAFRPIYSNDTSKFVNNEEGINMLFDDLGDGQTPILSQRLFKAGKDYPIMHPYMVEILDYFSKLRTKVALTDGTYKLNKYGCETTSFIKNVGIIEIQGAGGGSGGTNNKNSDCAGGGGGGGGYALIYYRIKNTDAKIDMITTAGKGGEGGRDGSVYGTAGQASVVSFKVNDNADLQYFISAGGGFGGETGNYNYTSGGNGGSVEYLKPYQSVEQLVEGGHGGSSSGDPTPATYLPQDDYYPDGRLLINDQYLFVYLLAAQGGAGGGRGDDTDGTCQGQDGFGTYEMKYKLPVTNGRVMEEFTLSARAGGKRGTNVADSAPGGGAGAGGAMCKDNANQSGCNGGNGIINIYV